jgi:hypothetical protein
MNNNLSSASPDTKAQDNGIPGGSSHWDDGIVHARQMATFIEIKQALNLDTSDDAQFFSTKDGNPLTKK